MKAERLEALRAWRAQMTATTEVALPSGLTVACKRVELLDLAANGQIPAPLLGAVEKLMQPDGTATTKVDMNEWPTFAELINVVVKATVVEPPIADEPDAEHVGIRELPISDRLFIFNWANSGANALDSFRAESAGDVAAAQSGEGVRAAAKPDSGDRG